jgi:galactose mutarotase-like enzyme
MRIDLQHTQVGSCSAVVMQNDAIQVTVVPEIGGKIISLRSLRSGREWLWKNPYLPLRKPPPQSTDFGAFDCGGWDEVFPTINACRVPDSAWGNRLLTNHGELWYRPWQLVAAHTRPQTAGVLTLAVDDPQFPFRFERSLTLEAGLAPLAASYSIVNKSPMPMPFIWAAHPLLAIEPGDSFRMPAGTRISTTGNVGLELATNLPELTWPIVPLTSGDSLNLSRAPEMSARYAIKLFAESVPGGAIEIANRDQTEALCISFVSHQALHVGLWLNYGAWSGANSPPYYNAGVEPTNFPHDDLNVAARSQSSILAPGAACHWRLVVSIEGPKHPT